MSVIYCEEGQIILDHAALDSALESLTTADSPPLLSVGALVSSRSPLRL